MVDSEAHMLYSVADMFSADMAGLDVMSRLPYVCEHCGKPVGFLCGEFVPTAAIFDGNSQWFLCEKCVAPMIKPGVAR